VEGRGFNPAATFCTFPGVSTPEDGSRSSPPQKAKNPPASSLLAVGSRNLEFELASQMPRLPAPESAPVQQTRQQHATILRQQLFMCEEYTRTSIRGNRMRLRQPDPLDQRFVAGIAAQRIEVRMLVNPYEPGHVIVVGPLQPSKRLLFLSQTRIGKGKLQR